MHTIRVAKIARDVQLDFDALPESSKLFVVNYGLKQLLNDAIVSGETDDERNGLLDKKLDKLREGTMSVRDSSGRSGDPLARQITALATERTEAHFKKLGVKRKDVASADWTTVLNKFRAHPKIIETATAMVAAKATDEIELD